MVAQRQARTDLPVVGQYAPQTATLTGQPFNCANWLENSGASIVVPNVTTDVELPAGLGSTDLPQAMRLNDD